MALNPQFGGLIPSGTQEVLNSNYLQFNANTAGNTNTGNRTLSGFLRMVGAEMPMTSDQVIWSEQNRLHISYSGVAIANQGGATLSAITIAAPAVNTISINDTIVVLNPVTGGESKGIVVDSGAYGGSALAAGVIHFQPFDNVRFPAAIAAVGCKIFVYGSDYQKGQSMAGAFGAAGAVPAANAPRISVDPVLTQFSNSPIILRNQYVVNGSDMAQMELLGTYGT